MRRHGDGWTKLSWRSVGTSAECERRDVGGEMGLGEWPAFGFAWCDRRWETTLYRWLF